MRGVLSGGLGGQSQRRDVNHVLRPARHECTADASLFCSVIFNSKCVKYQLGATNLPMRSSKKRSVASRASFSPSRTRTAAARRLPGVRLLLRGGRRVQAGAGVACTLFPGQMRAVAVWFAAACNDGRH